MLKPARLKKCRICRMDFRPLSSTSVTCSLTCALAHVEREKALQARRQQKEERKGDAVKREALKTRSDWMKEAQVAFNAYIRERDRAAGYTCISSGRPLKWDDIGGGVDAGHYRSVGSAPHLRFDERNCHAQSKQDNRWGSGNAVDYRIGLIKRIGLAAVEALEADQTVRKWSIDDLRYIKTLYKAKLKELLAQREEVAA